MSTSGDSKTSRPAIVLVVALVYIAMWSTSFIAIKIGVRSSPPLTLLSIRFLIAGGLLAAMARWTGIRFPNMRGWLRLGTIGLLNMGLPAALNFIALRRASASMASIVLVVNPVLLTLLGPKLLGEQLSSRKILGLMFGVGGVLTVMSTRLGAGGKADTPLGVGLMLIGVLGQVCSTLLFKRFPPREPLLIVNVAQQLVSGLLIVPIALATENPMKAVISGSLIFSLLHLVFIVSVGCGLIWFWLLGKGEASVASSALFLAPGCGVVVAWLLLGERFSSRDALGLVAVTMGVVLIRTGGAKKKPALPAAQKSVVAPADGASAGK